MERYRIIEPLGSGGFGSVYKAQDTMLERHVAVKRLDKGVCETELREQLLREARILATMQHPNIVSIYDINQRDDYDEIVMELLQGITLHDLTKRQLLQPSDFKVITEQILQALRASHGQGVLHCDIKPENIMLTLSSDERYEAKVYDFGMSLPSEEEQKQAKTKLVGSIYVMAPELFSNESPSEQSDLYALGCVLYYLLVGCYPFRGESSIQIMAAHIKGEYTCPSALRPDLPPALCTWLTRILDKDKNSRTPSAKEALHSLQEIEFTDQQQEFTLPTSLSIEGSNSRRIHKITIESFEASTELNAKNHSTAFLSNSFSYAQPLAKKKSTKPVTQEPAQPLSQPDEQSLPDDAEWYFTIGEKVKGPVTTQQLAKLCHEGKIVAETLVWHALLGDWIQAESCAETKAAFDEKQRQEEQDEQLRLQAIAQAQAEEEEQIVIEQKELYAWLGIEVFIVLSAGCVTLIFGLIYPEIWHYFVATYFFTLLAVGLSCSRIYQLRNGLTWSIFVPLFGDIYHIFSLKNTRSLLCAMMVFTGIVGLAIFSVGEVKAIEAKTACTLEQNRPIAEKLEEETKPTEEEVSPPENEVETAPAAEPTAPQIEPSVTPIESAAPSLPAPPKNGRFSTPRAAPTNRFNRFSK